MELGIIAIFGIIIVGISGIIVKFCCSGCQDAIGGSGDIMITDIITAL